MTVAMLRALALPVSLLAAVLGVAACVNPPPPPPTILVGPPPNPYPPPPPPQPEQRPLPPVSEDQLVWRMGEWDWVGTGYTWRPGEWEKLGNHSVEYLAGHWALQGGAWVWESGHWL